MKLLKPSVVYQQTYLEVLKEGEKETQLDRLKDEESFYDFVQRLNNYEKGL